MKTAKNPQQLLKNTLTELETGDSVGIGLNLDSGSISRHIGYYTGVLSMLPNLPNGYIEQVEADGNLNSLSKKSRVSSLQAHIRNTLMWLDQSSLDEKVDQSALKILTDRPDFSKLIANGSDIERVLFDSWEEAERGYEVKNWRSVNAMIGALIELVLLLRVQRDEKAAREASAKIAKKPWQDYSKRSLSEWNVTGLLHAARELGWIDSSLFKFVDGVRLNRNNIHLFSSDQNEHTKESCDSAWKVLQQLSKQILTSLDK